MESTEILPQRRRAPRSSAGEGQVLGRYRLLEKLGAGGFGVVWRAHDELLGRDVAVKRIELGPGGDPERATREAQATARLSHPAIVALYEACSQGEAFWLISELVDGQTLGRLLAQEALEDEEILEIGLDLLDALEHAHARGVIHRDIKPQNVLVPYAGGASRTAAGRPIAAKLTDFGGASIAEEDALTRTGDVLGTLAYMAPEQSEGREVAEEADLYSLALVLYEALAGENPVRGATPAETARRIGSRLPALASCRRDLPPTLTCAIDDALAPDPRDRGTLEDLREAVEEALEEGLEAPRRAIVPARRRAESPSRTLRHVRPRIARRSEERHGEAPATADLHQRGPEGGEAAVAPLALPVPDRGGLPRSLWVALGLAGAVWLAVTGKSGASLLLLAALAPLVAMPAEPYSRRVSPLWLAALLAPALGLAGLAGAYPAAAGQARAWSRRAALGALGYWWLMLAEPLLDRRLWLGPPAHLPPRHAWESSLSSTATHVVGPLLSTGVLLGAALWAVGALVLPWVVRGAHAALDAVVAAVWAAALCAVAPRLDSGLAAATHPSPRGAVLGAVLGALLAIGARALRGPV